MAAHDTTACQVSRSRLRSPSNGGVTIGQLKSIVFYIASVIIWIPVPIINYQTGLFEVWNGDQKSFVDVLSILFDVEIVEPADIYPDYGVRPMAGSPSVNSKVFFTISPV